MSVTTNVMRVKKLVQRTMLLDVLREFPGLTEEELQATLESWRAPMTVERYLKEHGPLPWDPTESQDVDIDKLKPPLSPEELQHRPRFHGVEEPIVSKEKALKMIVDVAPNIPPEELDRDLYLQISFNRRHRAETTFFIDHGYWPEQEPAKSETEVEYFQRHGAWPGHE